MKYFIANWKAHKNETEAYQWCDGFKKLLQTNEKVLNRLKSGEIKVIICPPHPLLHLVKQQLSAQTGVSIGAQDISKYDEGNYTGEVDGRVLSETVSHVIIGHSERRNYFGENNQDIEKKLKMANQYGISSILCLRSEADFVSGAQIIAFEPETSIGTGKNDSLAHILDFKKKLGVGKSSEFLYGGSVNAQNDAQYLQDDNINGLLIGTASLDPSLFYDIISGY